jgi:FAD/FMN-containing dehydrogenase
MIISNWGNYPKIDAHVYCGSFAEDFKNTLSKSEKFICRGNGRSYGDASLNDHIISMDSYSRFIDFDLEKGILTCQA